MAALKFLAIVWLLLVISPCHGMNMTHTKSLNLKRYGYIYPQASVFGECIIPICIGMMTVMLLVNNAISES